MEKTMTMREFLKAITEGTVITEELEAFALAEIEKLNAKNEKKKVSPSALKKKAEQENLIERVVEVLEANSTMSASEVAKALTTDELEISTPKATALLKKLVENGTIETGLEKRGTRKATVYSLITNETTEDGD